MSGLTPSQAKEFYDGKVTVLEFPAGWVGRVELDTCLGCGNAVIMLIFENEALNSRGEVQIDHASKKTNVFEKTEERWAGFEENAPSIMSQLTEVGENANGMFMDTDAFLMPGFGVGIAINVGDFMRLIEQLYGGSGNVPRPSSDSPVN